MTDDAKEFNLGILRQLMTAHNVKQLLVKELSANDNSKNQPYLGTSLNVLNLLPTGPLRQEITKDGNVGFKAPLSFAWLATDGSVTEARHAQIILYPQYPEVRMSGLLKHLPRSMLDAPNALIRERRAGRLLFLGITQDSRVVAWITSPDSKLAAEINALGELKTSGVLKHIPLGDIDNSLTLLLQKLREIHVLGWIESQRLFADGTIGACNGTNCGGYTLEAHFGIIPNGRAEPDYQGWEIKGHAVSAFTRPPIGQLTLMTPEPTGGMYKDQGPEAFIRRYGYPDRSGIADRINFSSPHRFGVKNDKTGLTLRFVGFTPGENKFDPTGGFSLMDDNGIEAAKWHFAGLIEHWKKKHAKAVYVPYLMRSLPSQQYAYGDRVRLGEETDFLRFLSAMGEGKVYYDPGIKLEGASTAHPTIKRRSQFRIKSAEIANLYARMEIAELLR